MDFLSTSPAHDVCCAVEGPGRDYSNEIYTADLHIAGLAHRLGLNVGPPRYLLLSLTYGSRAIRMAFRILDDLGVRRNMWWGYTATVFDNLRVPFTSLGVRYDLNHRKWIGPDQRQRIRGALGAEEEPRVLGGERSGTRTGTG